MTSVMTIGRHRLVCGDITVDETLETLMGDERADVIYSDPPWGPGLLQTFATMTEPGSAPRLPWPAFLDALGAAADRFAAPLAPVLIEMGLRWVDELDEAMARAGRPPRRRWATFYGPRRAPRPSTLSLYGARDLDLALPEPPHGEPMTRAALAAVVQSGMVVLDVCTGLGMTARVTHALGASFRGAELNHVRLARAAAWLRGRCA